MEKSAADTKKDFSSLSDDYAFFQNHSTERSAIEDAMTGLIDGLRVNATAIRLLDFGAGSGDLTAALIQKSALLSRTPLTISIVEPSEGFRLAALAKLNPFSNTPAHAWTELPSGEIAFDLILANHVFYYVENLEKLLTRLLTTLSPWGMAFVTMADNENALIQYWQRQFERLGMPVPYNMCTDIERVLIKGKFPCHFVKAISEVSFEDSIEGRHHMARFLLGKYFCPSDSNTAIADFDRCLTGGRIRMPLSDNIYVISGAKS